MGTVNCEITALDAASGTSRCGIISDTRLGMVKDPKAVMASLTRNAAVGARVEAFASCFLAASVI